MDASVFPNGLESHRQFWDMEPTGFDNDLGTQLELDGADAKDWNRLSICNTNGDVLYGNIRCKITFVRRKAESRSGVDTEEIGVFGQERGGSSASLALVHGDIVIRQWCCSGPTADPPDIIRLDSSVVDTGIRGEAVLPNVR